MNPFYKIVMAGVLALSTCAESRAVPSRGASQPRTPRYVDISAMVKVQVEQALAGTEVTDKPHSEVADQGGRDGQAGSLVAFGIAVLLSAVSTTFLLRGYSAMRGRPATGVVDRLEEAEAPAEQASAVRSFRSEEQWSTAGPTRPAPKTVVDERPVHDNHTFRLLQSFHRGHGELSLAMKLSSDTRGGRTRDKLDRALPQVDSEDTRAAVARKFGMGKGEIDLAVHLNELQTSRLRKEKAQ